MHILPWKRALPLALSTLAVASSLDTRDTIIAPLQIPPDQNWDGIDGSWSTFTLRVGTPYQYCRTFLSFQSYQTWVVIQQGCSTASNPTDCANARGGIFNYTASSTWQQRGTYNTYIEQNLGIVGNALYGFDTVGLALNGENGPTLKNTTVGGVAVDDWYLGIFGVNPKPTNFSSFNDPAPSYLSQLLEQRLIPSLSFSYTAGAKYRFAGVYASLTLGGYDTSQYTPNNITFNFGQDNDHQIIVGVQSISTANKDTTNNVPVQLLPNAVYMEVDSTVAQIWLPIEACKVIEAEFGLTYDDTTNLYLLNDTQRQSLQSRNPNITFTIGQSLSGGSTMQIVLPYAAFDQIAKAPYQGMSGSSYYFPLRRAANNTQYILGRTFMQEAYVIVDYEVSRFQLAQTVWNQYSTTNLVPIQAANASTDSSLWTSGSYKASGGSGGYSTGTNGSQGLGTGAIVGIVIGVVALIAAALLAYFLIRRRRRPAQATEIPSMAESLNDEKNGAVFQKAELAGSEPLPFGMTHHDLDHKGFAHSPLQPPLSAGGTTAYSPGSPGWAGSGTMSSNGLPATPPAEAHSRAIYEMPGDMPNTEKDGRQFSEKEALQHRERIYNGIDEAVEGSSPSGTEARCAERRVVAPGEVVNAETGDALGRHRAFSFEFDPSDPEVQQLSHGGEGEGSHDSERTLAQLSPHSPSSADEDSTMIGLADGATSSHQQPWHGHNV